MKLKKEKLIKQNTVYLDKFIMDNLGWKNGMKICLVMKNGFVEIRKEEKKENENA